MIMPGEDVLFLLTVCIVQTRTHGVDTSLAMLSVCHETISATYRDAKKISNHTDITELLVLSLTSFGCSFPYLH